MTVDIGYEAINRADWHKALDTILNTELPASISGIITSIDIWASTSITGLRVGTFYEISLGQYRCRASVVIPGTIIAGSKITKVVSIAVEIGDLIGCYYTTGRIERDNVGFPGIWAGGGEYIDPGDTRFYGMNSDFAISLGGYIGVAGWTGKISTVVNPAKIMGVDVAGIASVKGVT